MPINDDIGIDYIDPKLIIIGERQRSETKIETLIDSIKYYGILNPIIVNKLTQDTIELYLVAGHRRLACALQLGLALVPIRYYDTLDPTELKLIELEENIKREDLSWQDHVKAIGNFHEAKKSLSKEWAITDTAEALSYSTRQINNVLTVFNSLKNPLVANADNLAHASGIVQRNAERVSASIVEELLRVPTKALGKLNDALVEDILLTSDEEIIAETIEDGSIPEVVASYTRSIFENVISKDQAPTIPNPIITADFIGWSDTHAGPKFNLIHCDFPYDINPATITHQRFYELTNTFATNIDNFTSYSAHIMFWANFDCYNEIKTKLRQAGLYVFNKPLIWFKSDLRNSAPGVRGLNPKDSYEICLLAYRGNRPLVRQVTDCYAAPTVTSPIHPQQKPESMLKHFLAMLTDNVTDFLDICSGSGSALRAAEDLGARNTLGIEINPEYATAANALTLSERKKRALNRALTSTENKSESELEL